jgi:hypothetical protein
VRERQAAETAGGGFQKRPTRERQRIRSGTPHGATFKVEGTLCVPFSAHGVCGLLSLIHKQKLAAVEQHPAQVGEAKLLYVPAPRRLFIFVRNSSEDSLTGEPNLSRQIGRRC